VADTWQHMVFTRDESNIKLYVNGELYQTVTSTSFTKCGATTATIGRKPEDGSCYINGQINDYRIYDHVLSLREIKEIYKGLIMHLPLSFGANPNLAQNSVTMGASSGNSGNFTHETVYYDGQPVRRFTCVNSSYGPWGNPFDIGKGAVVDNTYTWSAMIRASKNVTKTIGHEAGGRTNFNLTTEWQYIKYTWTYTQSSYNAFTIYNNWAVDDWVEIKNLKIEEGSEATPYIPHVNETQYSKTLMDTNYLNECSGYGISVSKVGSNFTPCTSPKRVNATTCGASSCINLGTSIKVQYPFSFAFWFNTSDLAYGNNRLISCTEGGGWNVEGNGDYLSWTIGTGSSSNTYKNCISTTPRTELQEGWHHIVCTYDGLKAQMYLDGILNKEVTYFNTATPVYYHASNAVFLCGESGGSATTPATTYSVDTSVSDFRFYTSILSAEDVKELYSLAASIDDTGKMYCYSYIEQ
jgi:hypothetical protein